MLEMIDKLISKFSRLLITGEKLNETGNQNVPIF